ncbi:hypothetical protein K505DRAFT_416009 [Melanomma pulvis-pyrius CBS 109.77]|uniref:Uncharacterized protein n=1 Tax=Melanomma pulvis-pyrius CBS 109.77 TaxID=1314802 RepID=A0A6A6XHZ7_9PLEO|nr:hypothetical protein K505DRAFT_416009 [Melanomma pulvis-pyrius CBS 109.77]
MDASVGGGWSHASCRRTSAPSDHEEEVPRERMLPTVSGQVAGQLQFNTYATQRVTHASTQCQAQALAARYSIRPVRTQSGIVHVWHNKCPQREHLKSKPCQSLFDKYEASSRTCPDIAQTIFVIDLSSRQHAIEFFYSTIYYIIHYILGNNKASLPKDIIKKKVFKLKGQNGRLRAGLLVTHLDATKPHDIDMRDIDPSGIFDALNSAGRPEVGSWKYEEGLEKCLGLGADAMQALSCYRAHARFEVPTPQDKTAGGATVEEHEASGVVQSTWSHPVDMASEIWPYTTKPFKVEEDLKLDKDGVVPDIRLDCKLEGRAGRLEGTSIENGPQIRIHPVITPIIVRGWSTIIDWTTQGRRIHGGLDAKHPR